MNQPSVIRPGDETPALDAPQAAALLGVRPATLYAYVSRGLVRRVAGTTGRRSLYLRSDLLRLQARQRARAGHGAVAAGALVWGEPVLDSAITALTPEGPAYRGRNAVALAQGGWTFEAVTDLLWDDDAPAPWPPTTPSRAFDALLPLRVPGMRPLAGLGLALPWLAQRDPDRVTRAPSAERLRARRLIADLTLAAALASGPTRLRAAARAPSLDARTCTALGVTPSRAARNAVRAALVLCADHELNTSAFVARVVASTGADLYAVVSAALAALSGAEHGGACDRIEALLGEVRRETQARRGDARSVMRGRLSRGEAIPGFGHPLYAGGDPRGHSLMAIARKLPRARPRLRIAESTCAVMRELGHPGPSIDFALVALCEALGAAPGTAVTLFALGRTTGWIAHALEQRQTPVLLRPRARYVGVAPASVPPSTARPAQRAAPAPSTPPARRRGGRFR